MLHWLVNAKIVLATGNPHKVEEMRAILAGVAHGAGVEVVGLRDLPGGDRLPEPSETGLTFEANASIKALEYARATGRWCLADDSGLEVDALGGSPGVISSHYSSDGRETGMSRSERDAANNARLLRELEGVPPERRTARFVCMMALARPGYGPHQRPEVVALARGTFEGRIGLPGPPPVGVPRGAHGFGYDPLFLVAPEFARTSAEFEPIEKNRLSHRARAGEQMSERIRALAREISPAAAP